MCQRDIKDIVMTWMKSLDWRFSGVALYMLNERVEAGGDVSRWTFLKGLKIVD